MTANAPNARKRILLIDDDELIAGSLRQYLVMQSCDVDVAPEALSADVLLRSEHYDVVMLDPYLTGGVQSEDFALMDSVSLLQPNAELIVLTGYSSAALEHAAAAGTVRTLLAKPQSIVYLSELLMSPSTSTSAKGQTE
jgi:DNA-binding NtrC family response regulator